MSRRHLLRVALGGGLVVSVSAPWWFEREADARTSARSEGDAGSYSFFTPSEVAWVDAAVGRLIPEDASGPGAVQAGVTFFIDQQLEAPQAFADAVLAVAR